MVRLHELMPYSIVIGIVNIHINDSFYFQLIRKACINYTLKLLRKKSNKNQLKTKTHYQLQSGRTVLLSKTNLLGKHHTQSANRTGRESLIGGQCLDVCTLYLILSI